MEEKKPGKRLAVGATKSPGAKRGLIIVGAVAAALAAAYVALCAWVGTTSGNPLPGTAVAGVDIGGLSFPQAQEKLEQEFSRRDSPSPSPWPETARPTIPIGAVEADVLRPLPMPTPGPGRTAFSPGRLFSQEPDRRPTMWRYPSASPRPERLRWMTFWPGSSLSWAAWSRRPPGPWRVTSWCSTWGSRAGLSTCPQSRATFSPTSPPETPPLWSLPPRRPIPAAVDLEQVHSEVCTEVSNASLDPETFEITPSVTGLDFEISTASAALEGAAWGSDVSVPLAVTEPTVSTESLRDLLVSGCPRLRHL